MSNDTQRYNVVMIETSCNVDVGFVWIAGKLSVQQAATIAKDFNEVLNRHAINNWRVQIERAM